MKKNRVLTAVLAGVMTTAIAATMCSVVSAKNINKKSTQKTTTSPVTVMPNPFTDCGQDMSKAAIVSGFIFHTPFYSNYTVIAADGITQINLKSKDLNYDIKISKEKGENEPATTYDYVSINDVRLKDTNAKFAIENGKVYDAYWTENGYTYSLSDENGLKVDDAVGHILEIIEAENTMN